MKNTPNFFEIAIRVANSISEITPQDITIYNKQGPFEYAELIKEIISKTAMDQPMAALITISHLLDIDTISIYYMVILHLVKYDELHTHYDDSCTNLASAILDTITKGGKELLLDKFKSLIERTRQYMQTCDLSEEYTVAVMTAIKLSHNKTVQNNLTRKYNMKEMQSVETCNTDTNWSENVLAAVMSYASQKERIAIKNIRNYNIDKISEARIYYDIGVVGVRNHIITEFTYQREFTDMYFDQNIIYNKLLGEIRDESNKIHRIEFKVDDYIIQEAYSAYNNKIPKSDLSNYWLQRVRFEKKSSFIIEDIKILYDLISIDANHKQLEACRGKVIVAANEKNGVSAKIINTLIRNLIIEIATEIYTQKEIDIAIDINYRCTISMSSCFLHEPIRIYINRGCEGEGKVNLREQEVRTTEFRLRAATAILGELRPSNDYTQQLDSILKMEGYLKAGPSHTGEFKTSY